MDSIGVATHCHQDHDFMHAKHLSERREQILVGHHFELQNKLWELGWCGELRVRAYFRWELGTFSGIRLGEERGWSSLICIQLEGSIFDLNFCIIIVGFFIHSFILFNTHVCHLIEVNNIKRHVSSCQHNLTITEITSRARDYIGNY